MRLTAKEYKKKLLFELIAKHLKNEDKAEALAEIKKGLENWREKILNDKSIFEKQGDKDTLNYEEVEENICVYFGTTPEKLHGENRKGSLPDIRHILLYFCYQYIRLPIEQITYKAPAKHHSSFYHARKKCKNPYLLHDDYIEFTEFMNNKYELKIVTR